MGDIENTDLKIIKTDNKTYNLENTEEAIDFLIFALNGINHSCFIEEFVFGHLGIDYDEYLDSLEERGKDFFAVDDDVSPFFDLFIQDWETDNVFYKYVYFSQASDLIKKQKINRIIDGLKRTLDYYFLFSDVSIFRNIVKGIETDKNFRELAYQKEFSDAYLYYVVTFKMISIYNYLYRDFYSFIDEKNIIDPSYASMDNNEALEELVREYNQKFPEEAIIIHTMEAKINPTDYSPDIFKSIEVYNSFKDYTSKFIIDPFTDFSYLFQRMLHEGLIHKKKLMEYVDWLKENKFIKDNTRLRFFENGGLVSLNKSSSVNRENNFNLIFKL